jgi:hypothetical protein
MSIVQSNACVVSNKIRKRHLKTLYGKIDRYQSFNYALFVPIIFTLRISCIHI